MKPTFWKLSHGSDYFSFGHMLESVYNQVVVMHKSTKAKGKNKTKQGENFISAPIGDYFYLTHGNEGIYLLGQFTGPVDYFYDEADGWVSRPFKFIAASQDGAAYDGEEKWWTPNHRSTFVQVPADELKDFEKWILQPYFGIKLKKFGIKP